MERGRGTAIGGALVLLVGLWARWRVLGSVQGTLNADEAYTGLQAMAIRDGDLPVVIRGAAYTGVVDAYVLAPIHAVLGAHPVMLKVYSSLLWGVAAVIVGLAARRLGLRDAIALVCVGGIWVGSGPLVVLSTRAYLSYGSGLLAVSLAILIAIDIASRDRSDARASALFGGVAGLAVFLHPMFLTVLVPLSAVTSWRHRRDWRAWWLPAGLAAVAVNLPFLIWNARNDWPSLSQPIEASDTWGDRLTRFFTGLVPRSLGLMGEGRGWVVPGAIAALVIIAVVALALVGISAAVRQRSMVLSVVVVPVLVCWPLMAMLANLSFVADSRYAVIYLPFLVLSVAIGAEHLAARVPAPLRRMGPVVVPVALVAITVPPWLHSQAPATPDADGVARTVIDALDEATITRLSGHYWGVLPVQYASDGRIVTAVSGNPYVVRLPESQRIVENADPGRLAHLHPASADPSLPLAADAYRVTEVGGYRLYIPVDG